MSRLTLVCALWEHKLLVFLRNGVTLDVQSLKNHEGLNMMRAELTKVCPRTSFNCTNVTLIQKPPPSCIHFKVLVRCIALL